MGGKKSGEWASRQEKRQDRKRNGSRQKNTRGDSRVESNYSPKIPDRGETSDILGLPSGCVTGRRDQIKNLNTRILF